MSGAATRAEEPAGAGSALIGRVLGERYAIVSVLGSGAMGHVYAARQLGLDQRVAIKVIRPERGADASELRRFHREALATTRLTSPHVVRVYEQATDAATGAPFLVMERLHGRTLARALREEGALSVARTVDILTQVTRALVEAEQVGIVHRDLKPDNLFLVDTPDHSDFVKVMDFGIARSLTGLLDATGSDARIAGTPGYISPEQASGGAVDARSDLYAVGCMLHELLCDEKPFASAGDALATLIAHVTQPPPVLPASTPHGEPIPESLRVIHQALLQKSPARRPASAQALLAALRTVADGRPLQAPMLRELTGREPAERLAATQDEAQLRHPALRGQEEPISPQAQTAESAPLSATAAAGAGTLDAWASEAPSLLAALEGPPAPRGRSRRVLWVGLAATALTAAWVVRPSEQAAPTAPASAEAPPRPAHEPSTTPARPAAPAPTTAAPAPTTAASAPTTALARTALMPPEQRGRRPSEPAARPTSRAPNAQAEARAERPAALRRKPTEVKHEPEEPW